MPGGFQSVPTVLSRGDRAV